MNDSDRAIHTPVSMGLSITLIGYSTRLMAAGGEGVYLPAEFETGAMLNGLERGGSRSAQPDQHLFIVFITATITTITITITINRPCHIINNNKLITNE